MQDPHIHFTEWLPQEETLMRDDVVVGLCNCEFDDVTDFIAGAVPILSFPHHGDEGINAK